MSAYYFGYYLYFCVALFFYIRNKDQRNVFIIDKKIIFKINLKCLKFILFEKCKFTEVFKKF